MFHPDIFSWRTDSVLFLQYALRKLGHFSKPTHESDSD